MVVGGISYLYKACLHEFGKSNLYILSRSKQMLAIKIKLTSLNPKFNLGLVGSKGSRYTFTLKPINNIKAMRHFSYLNVEASAAVVLRVKEAAVSGVT